MLSKWRAQLAAVSSSSLIIERAPTTSGGKLAIVLLLPAHPPTTIPNGSLIDNSSRKLTKLSNPHLYPLDVHQTGRLTLIPPSFPCAIVSELIHLTVRQSSKETSQQCLFSDDSSLEDGAQVSSQQSSRWGVARIVRSVVRLHQAILQQDPLQASPKQKPPSNGRFLLLVPL